jgi:hypothetical protein
MPIRFACSHCGQRLSVGSHKAGKLAACPKCKSTITVPLSTVEPPTAEPELPEIVPEPPPLEIATALPELDRNEAPPSFDFDRDIEVVYETRSAAPSRSARKKRTDDEGPLDLDRVSLPRYVLFVQGGLLVVVGIVCFLLGMAVGGAVTESGGQANQQSVPISITGTVAIASEGGRTPDAGALVIFFPYGVKPDEKGNLVGVRPGDDPAKGVKLRNYLRVLGGGLAYCDQRGQYSVQLPDRGRYYLLSISSQSQPSRAKPMPPQEIAEIGQFVSLSDDPLDKFRYQWRLETLRGSQRLNVEFD